MTVQLTMFDILHNADEKYWQEFNERVAQSMERHEAEQRAERLSLGITDCPICGSTRIHYGQTGYIFPNIYGTWECVNCRYRVHGDHMGKEEVARKWVEEYKKIKKEALNG